MPMTDLLGKVFLTFVASLVPGLELRAGIPTGVVLGLPIPVAVVVSVAGNILQIVMALYLIEWVYRHATRFPRIERWLKQTEELVVRHRSLIQRYGWIGLAAFVLLPLPGTGAWGGAVLARLLQVSVAGVWLGLSLGIALSGVLVGVAVHGALTMFSLF